MKDLERVKYTTQEPVGQFTSWPTNWTVQTTELEKL